MSALSTQEKTRRPVDWIVPALVVAAIVFLPPLFYPLAGGWGILIGLLLVSFGGALIDARLFRDNLTFPGLVGLAYAMDLGLYFNSGTWIYLPLMGVVAVVGTIVGVRSPDKGGA